MGFTLAAARRALPMCATVVVAELVPKVVSWANGSLAHIFGDSLADPRVSLEVRDVHDVIVERAARFDAILLDVDNGPDALVNLANERLYCNWGLRAAHSALRPEGCWQCGRRIPTRPSPAGFSRPDSAWRKSSWIPTALSTAQVVSGALVAINQEAVTTAL
jgi:predicted membrane-bound spermidine synthase